MHLKLFRGGIIKKGSNITSPPLGINKCNTILGRYL